MVVGVTGRLDRRFLEEPKFKDLREGLLRKKPGVYILYSDDNLFYVGISHSLHYRLRRHLKDGLAEGWNNFEGFILRENAVSKDLETILQWVALPPANTQRGRFPREARYDHFLKRELQKAPDLANVARTGLLLPKRKRRTKTRPEGVS